MHYGVLLNMTKHEWVIKQVKLASGDFPELTAPFIELFLEAVKHAGEDLTQHDFLELFDSFTPEGAGSDHCEYMMIDTQLSYGCDFSEVWGDDEQDSLPEITVSAAYDDTPLPNDFVKLGGEPDWIQDESFPICKQCDKSMVLFSQFKSLSADISIPNVDMFKFGDMGNLYIFVCLSCRVFEVDTQCY